MTRGSGGKENQWRCKKEEKRGKLRVMQYQYQCWQRESFCVLRCMFLKSFDIIESPGVARAKHMSGSLCSLGSYAPAIFHVVICSGKPILEWSNTRWENSNASHLSTLFAEHVSALQHECPDMPHRKSWELLRVSSRARCESSSIRYLLLVSKSLQLAFIKLPSLIVPRQFLRYFPWSV